MRMWLVDPKILCQKHLCGEHLEMHMFVGSIVKGKAVDGYLQNNLLEPKKLKKRHDELSIEMINRGYNHKSPITDEEFNCCMSNLYSDQLDFRDIKINKNKSKKDLLNRCSMCYKRYKELINE